ncbi:MULTISPECIES: HIT family protein [Terrabacteria group]|uniref:HIT family protein n=1 Tax=Bacillati TaxID=1783272 RepID=UPI00193949D2|nr:MULTISPECIES: HIT family protein [Terrabacteria group]MBW9212355.1 HIT family protein [Trueperella sp. zg.1013]QRG86112.1 HIT family protein [Bulleidia sp. zg-1006]
MCLFCDIVAGKIPTYNVYEDEDILAFLDISQATKGHTLVIPKKHYSSLLDCPKQEAIKLMAVVSDLSKTLVHNLDAKGINVLSNAGEMAGQTVPHFHIHLLPRYSQEDGFKTTFLETNNPNYSSLLEQIKNGNH